MLPTSGSKKEQEMTQSILEAQIEPAENESNYASTPGRAMVKSRNDKMKLGNLGNEKATQESIHELTQALKSPRYAGSKEKGMANEFSSISINIKQAP